LYNCGRPITDFVEWISKLGYDRVFEYSVDAKITIEDEIFILMVKGHQQYSEIMNMETEDRRKFSDKISKAYNYMMKKFIRNG